MTWKGRSRQVPLVVGRRRAQMDLCALFKFWTWFFYFPLLFEEFSNIVLKSEYGKK